MIVILTAPDDVHADHVGRMLGERGAEFLRFDPAQFPAEAELTLAPAAGQVRATLHVGGRSVDLEHVRAVWVRRPGGLGSKRRQAQSQYQGQQAQATRQTDTAHVLPHWVYYGVSFTSIWISSPCTRTG